MRTIGAALAVAASLLVVAPGPTGPVAARADADSASHASIGNDGILRALAGARFVENRGQADPRVRFVLAGPAATVAFVTGGPLLSQTPSGPSTRRWTIQQAFEGGRADAAPVGEGRSQAAVSYFSGPRDRWIQAAPTFARVVYRSVWPGVDVLYSVRDGHLEYTFRVAPGADPGAIAIHYRAASSVTLGADGALRVSTPAGGFTDARPVAYQAIGSARARVAAGFVPRANGRYGFQVGPFDPSSTLVIDPVGIGYAGYIGGSGLDQGLAISTDDSGNAYVVGQTKSDERTFPVKVGPDLTENGQTDAFVCKVSTAGQMVYCGYIGGSEPDRGRGVAVDGQGQAYVYGWTRSKEKDGFPVTVGPDVTYNGGTSDTFICKVDAAGDSLLYCGYIGGRRHDEGKAVAVDATGAAYVTGGTKSDDLPANAGFSRPYSDNGDVFVAKVVPDGSGLAWLGYVGGKGSEHARGIGVMNGYVSFAGTTNSDQGSLPVKVGPDLTYNGGGGDAFVGRITPDASALTYLGYVGGNGFDDARDATVGGAGNLFLCGHTGSTQATFPVKVGPDLTYNGGKTDGFVAKVTPAGTLSIAGYVGGRADDACFGLDVDHAGSMYLSGRTFSDQGSFPVKLGPDLTYNGNGDAFVGQVGASGSGFVYCGYVGGTDKDVSWGLSVDGSGNAVLAGQTSSSQASFPDKIGPDVTYNGGGDAFVAQVVP